MTYLYRVEQLESQFRVVKYINIALIIILISVFAGGLIAGVAYTLNTPEVTQVLHDGTMYKCYHYPDGDMECVNMNDPDIGFGQIK